MNGLQAGQEWKRSASEADVLVVGGGLAGIVTALELLEQGCRVHLIDRADESRFGGLARESFGGMFFVDSPEQRRGGIADSAELALRDWLSVAEFEAGDHWPRAWAERYVNGCTPHVYAWLKQRGIRYFPVVHWVERGLFRPGNSVPRFHMVWGTGFELARVLVKALREHPAAATHLRLDFGLRVESLLLEGGSVRGVQGRREAQAGQDGEGEAFEIRAGTTVVATGGLGGSLEQVRRHWPSAWGTAPADMLNGAHPFNDGLVHAAVARCAGAVTHLDRMWPYAAGIAHPRPRHPNHGLSLVPPRSALWLNHRGERFGPMPLVGGYDTRYLVERICKEKQQYSWQVLNLKIACKELAVSGAEHNPEIRDKNWPGFIKTLLFGNRKLVRHLLAECPDFVCANSLPELAQGMNALAGNEDVDPAALAVTVAAYDALIARGPKFHNDEQLRRIAHARQYRGDRVRTSKFARIDDPAARPLIAIRERILSRKSLGGIQTDLEGRVLATDGAVLPGLYAVGEAAGFGGGGAHGRGALEGTFLGGCVLTARVAAYHIVGNTLFG